MSAAPRLAVVVLGWNSREDVLACLEGLRPALGPGDAVLAVDNGSSDGTADAVRRSHPWAEALGTGANLGYAGGNNAGIRAALDRGFPWILLLNPDARPLPGALDALLAAAAAAPRAGALQPLLLREADPSLVDSLGLRARRSLGAEDHGHGTPAAAAPAVPTPILGPCGAAALYRAEALRAAGLLDGDLFLLCEDLDLALRIRIAGWESLLVPGARVLHRRGVSGPAPSPEAARRRKYWLQRNTVACALRYWPAGLLLLHAPRLLYRALQALLLRGADPARPCLPLWRRFRAERAASRRGMAERGLDRWFA